MRAEGALQLKRAIARSSYSLYAGGDARAPRKVNGKIMDADVRWKQMNSLE